VSLCLCSWPLGRSHRASWMPNRDRSSRGRVCGVSHRPCLRPRLSAPLPGLQPTARGGYLLLAAPALEDGERQQAETEAAWEAERARLEQDAAAEGVSVEELQRRGRERAKASFRAGLTPGLRAALDRRAGKAS
jgi:hypothetical protein